MSALSKIQARVAELYGDNSANVYKGNDYDGTMQQYGYWYKPFGRSAHYLGRDETEALETLERIAESRREAAQGIG